MTPDKEREGSTNLESDVGSEMELRRGLKNRHAQMIS